MILSKLGNYSKFFTRKKVKKLPRIIKLKGWFLLKILEQRKIRKLYGNISRIRLKKIYKKVVKYEGNFFINFLKILEYRLDILVFKLNLFSTLKYCQFLIRSNKILVNKIFRNFYYIVKLHDIIEICKFNSILSKYVLTFNLKNIFTKKNKELNGIYLYTFLLNLNIFKNLKQIYLYIKKGFIIVNNVIIKFPKYKLVSNYSIIKIKNFGIIKKIKYNLKKSIVDNSEYINYLLYINKKKKGRITKKTYVIIFRTFFFRKKKFKTKKNILYNFLLNFFLFNFSIKKWFIILLNFEKKSKINYCIFSIKSDSRKIIYLKSFKKVYINFNMRAIKNQKYKAFRIKLKKKKKKEKSILIKYNKRYNYLTIFKLKQNFYMYNTSKIFVNKYFSCLKQKNEKIFRFTLRQNKNFKLNFFHFKKFNLTKSVHIEINYKLKQAILLKYFNSNSITCTNIIYLGVLTYYFFQYN